SHSCLTRHLTIKKHSSFATWLIVDNGKFIIQCVHRAKQLSPSQRTWQAVSPPRNSRCWSRYVDVLALATATHILNGHLDGLSYRPAGKIHGYQQCYDNRDW